MKHVKLFEEFLNEGFFGRLFGTDLFSKLGKMATSSDADGISVQEMGGKKVAIFDGDKFTEEDIVVEDKDNPKNRGFENQFGKLPRVERISGKLKLVVPGGDLYDRWMKSRKKEGWIK